MKNFLTLITIIMMLVFTVSCTQKTDTASAAENNAAQNEMPENAHAAHNASGSKIIDAMHAPMMAQPFEKTKNIDVDFLECRQRIVKLLEEENELLEIARVVGQDVLSDEKRLILETAKAIRLGFLQQNAMSEIDAQVSLVKQYKMMQTIILIYDKALKLVNKRIPLSEIRKLGFFEEYVQIKNTYTNEDIPKFSELNLKIKNNLKKLEEEYKNHI